GDKELPASSIAESITTVGCNIGQLIVSVTLLSMPLTQGSETGGVQAMLIVPLIVSVALLSMPLPQVSETGVVVVVLVLVLVVLALVLVLVLVVLSLVLVLVLALVSVVLALVIVFVLVSVVEGVQPSLLAVAILPSPLSSTPLSHVSDTVGRF